MTANLAAGCDQGAALVQDGRKTPRCALILTATVLASSLAFLDGAVVNIALPRIGAELGGGPSALQWLVTGYLLPLSVLQLLAGALGDHFGRRLVLMSGTLLFTIASALCAAAPTMDTLLVARVLQGVGAALLLPNSLAVLGSAFNGAERGTAVGTWTAAGAIASTIGPPIAGLMVDEATWRLVFLLNVPLGIAALWLARRVVPESGNGSLPLDGPGTTVATVGLLSLTWAVTRWSTGAPGGATPILAIAAAASLMSLCLVERARGGAAMIPLDMFASRTFVGLNLYTSLIYGAFGGLFVLLPYVLMTAGGYSATAAGSAILPLPIILGLLSRWAGSFSTTHGWRLSLGLGAALSGAGYAMFVLTGDGSYWTEVLPALVLVAVGMAIVIAPLTTAILSTVDDSHTATAAGFNSAVSRAGTLVAIAASGQVMAGDAAGTLAAFHGAAIAGALLCSLSALITILVPPSASRTART